MPKATKTQLREMAGELLDLYPAVQRFQSISEFVRQTMAELNVREVRIAGRGVVSAAGKKRDLSVRLNQEVSDENAG